MCCHGRYGPNDRRAAVYHPCLEPCPLCIGAIAMSGVRQVTFAAYDHWTGAIAWLEHFPTCLESRFKFPDRLEIVSLVLLTERVLQANSVHTPDLF